jgi:drug/metabolite transporter (DMT)-like permease
MTDNRTRLWVKSIMVLTLVLAGTVLFGQPGDPGGDPDVPITGLEYLIGGGALYGVRTLLKRMKQKGD